MRTILFGIAVTIAATLCAQAQTTAPGTVISADAIAQARALSETNKTVDRLVQGVTVPGGKIGVAVLRRDQAETTALIHSNVSETYIITEGTGTIVTGGSLQTPTATDLTPLWIGPSLRGVQVGGEAKDVGPGTVIVIPAGTPHRFSAINGVIRYYVIRTENVK
jgi:mannose-6-phosphate isomerase-like protein (cupin superfamily)